MIYHSYENKKCYFPPLMSNGEISFAPDAEGTLGYTADDYSRKGVGAFDGIVVRSRRRSALCANLKARVFPMGKFVFGSNNTLEKWSQELLSDEGCVVS